jgi:hypothetical protein
MAQRYGRKRRRAHQELIAAQQSKITSLLAINAVERRNTNNACDALQRFKNMMEDWDHDVRGILGPYSALIFDMPETHTVGKPTEITRLPLPERRTVNFLDPFCPTHQIEMHVAYLKHCTLRVFDDVAGFNQLRTYLRLRITGSGEQIYAFSEDYWQRFGRASRRDVHRLADDIAKVMMSKIGIEPEKRAGVRSEDAKRRK